MTSTDHAHVVAPPPLLYLGGLVAAAALQWYWPVALLPVALAAWLAAPVALAGLAMNLWGAYTMRRGRTAINPYRSTTSIVDPGPFGFSRNPLYLGMDLLFAGIILWLNSLWGVPVFILLLLVMDYGVILREEHYLEMPVQRTVSTLSCKGAPLYSKVPAECARVLTDMPARHRLAAVRWW